MANSVGNPPHQARAPGTVGQLDRAVVAQEQVPRLTTGPARQ